jgi:hypothetical protein
MTLIQQLLGPRTGQRHAGSLRSERYLLERFGSEIDLVISDVVLPDMAATELERRVEPFTAVDLTGAVWREMEANPRPVVSG